MLTRPGPDRFGEEADADPHQLAALPPLRLLLPQGRVAGGIQCHAQRIGVIT